MIINMQKLMKVTCNFLVYKLFIRDYVVYYLEQDIRNVKS